MLHPSFKLATRTASALRINDNLPSDERSVSVSLLSRPPREPTCCIQRGTCKFNAECFPPTVPVSVIYYFTRPRQIACERSKLVMEASLSWSSGCDTCQETMLLYFRLIAFPNPQCTFHDLKVPLEHPYILIKATSYYSHVESTSQMVSSIHTQWSTRDYISYPDCYRFCTKHSLHKQNP